MSRRRRAVRTTLVAGLALAGSLAGAPVSAHHGKDFLLVETAQLPHPGQVYLVGSFDYLRFEEGHELEASPAILAAVSRHLAVEVHGHVAQEDGEWSYESTAPGLRLSLPGDGPLWIGLAAEYEIAHREEAHDRVEGRLIADYRGNQGGLTVNLVLARAVGGDEPAEIGYAIGVRPDFDARLGWGIEAQGGLHNRDGHEVLLGLYAEPSDRVTVKAGVGRAFGDGLDWTVRTGFVIRF